MDGDLGMTGYRSQQTPAPDDPDRPDKLFSPLDGSTDRGAHGRFDDRAATWCPALRASLHRRAILAEVTMATAGVLVAARVGTGILASRRRPWWGRILDRGLGIAPDVGSQVASRVTSVGSATASKATSVGSATASKATSVGRAALVAPVAFGTAVAAAAATALVATLAASGARKASDPASHAGREGDTRR
jgi:hypothetical protein